MKKIVLAVALVCLSSTVAFAKAKGTPTPQNHSCVLSGAVVEKTKKECIKAGGKWEKNAAITTAPVETKAVETTKPVESAPVEAPATK